MTKAGILGYLTGKKLRERMRRNRQEKALRDVLNRASPAALAALAEMKQYHEEYGKDTPGSPWDALPDAGVYELEDGRIVTDQET